MKADKSSVLADPSFLDAELIGHDNLMHIFVIAAPSYPVASLTIRESPMRIINLSITIGN